MSLSVVSENFRFLFSDVSITGSRCFAQVWEKRGLIPLCQEGNGACKALECIKPPKKALCIPWTSTLKALPKEGFGFILPLPSIADVLSFQS